MNSSLGRHPTSPHSPTPNPLWMNSLQIICSLRDMRIFNPSNYLVFRYTSIHVRFCNTRQYQRSIIWDWGRYELSIMLCAKVINLNVSIWHTDSPNVPQFHENNNSPWHATESHTKYYTGQWQPWQELTYLLLLLGRVLVPCVVGRNSISQAGWHHSHWYILPLSSPYSTCTRHQRFICHSRASTGDHKYWDWYTRESLGSPYDR